MTLSDLLWLGYDAPLAVFLAIAWIMLARGRRGKLSRAFLLTAVVGAVTPWVVYFAYVLLVPKPIVPHHVVEDSPSFFALLFNLLNKTDKSLDLIGYNLELFFLPILLGIASVLITFPLSFLFPYKPPVHAVKDLSTSSG